MGDPARVLPLALYVSARDVIAQIGCSRATAYELLRDAAGRERGSRGMPPPTDAEIAAHAGEWLILLSSGGSTVEHMEWPSSRDYWVLRGAVWWWPLRDGRPCPWPVTP